jgi:hypothetical protein
MVSFHVVSVVTYGETHDTHTQRLQTFLYFWLRKYNCCDISSLAVQYGICLLSTISRHCAGVVYVSCNLIVVRRYLMLFEYSLHVVHCLEDKLFTICGDWPERMMKWDVAWLLDHFCCLEDWLIICCPNDDRADTTSFCNNIFL